MLLGTTVQDVPLRRIWLLLVPLLHILARESEVAVQPLSNRVDGAEYPTQAKLVRD